MSTVPVYTPIASRPSPALTGPGSHKTAPSNLHHYRLRSVLTLFGPFLILGFYGFICVYFLGHPPESHIVLSREINGTWIFYTWFVVSVLVIDWARTGLANIEACALMYPYFAPSTIGALMWHTDAKWSNPLWWMRALSAHIAKFVLHRSSSSKSSRCVPGGLWMLLASASAAALIAIPLSGLSFETTRISVVSGDLANISGPGQTSFGINPASKRVDVGYAWRTGQHTTKNGALFYAPTTANHSSKSYFDDMLSKHPPPYIETFVGPYVRTEVSGRAWGLWSNLSCSPVAVDKLQMIRTNRYDNVSINFCRTSTAESCKFRWTNISELDHQHTPAPEKISLPVWLYKAGVSLDDLATYSIVVAADGFNQISTQKHPSSSHTSPYFVRGQHDNFTFAHFANTSGTDITTAMIEVYFWETRFIPDPQIEGWSKKTPDTISIVNASNSYINQSMGSDNSAWAGFGLHCDIASAVGFAYLDPSRQQFSSFSPSAALTASNSTKQRKSPNLLMPLQIQAIVSMFGENGLPTTEASRTQHTEHDSYLWLAIQDSIAANPTTLSHKTKSGNVAHVLPMLAPEGLQKSMYKLLGYHIAVLMGETGRPPWKGELYGLRQATYIVAGPLPWQYVAALLVFWASLTSGGAVWMLMARPRWAATLDGFEMYKLGAQYGNESHGSTRV